MLFGIFNCLVSEVKSFMSRVKSWPSSLRLKPEICQKSVLGQVSHPECGLCQCTESRLYSVSLLVRASGLGIPDGCWPLVTPLLLLSLVLLLFFAGAWRGARRVEGPRPCRLCTSLSQCLQRCHPSRTTTSSSALPTYLPSPLLK